MADDQIQMDTNSDEDILEKNEDSDSSDSSDDSDNDEALLQRISELQTEVDANPYNYNPHVELINLLRKDADLDKLRVARERMSAIFPLTETLWLDWLQDEQKIATSEAECESVKKLFERAIQDYLSVDVWLEYVQFSIGQMGMANGVANVREVFERALTAASLHVVKGSIIWEAYREFENALLAALQTSPGSVLTETQQKEYEDQKNRVFNLFKRQLNIPFLDMETTYEEFKEWLTEDVDAVIQSGYNKALTKLEAIKPFEEALLMADSPRLPEYESYVEFELKGNDPARIQCTFERALAENCLVPELWIKYVSYLEKKLKIETVSLPVMERSVRNCPWSVILWQMYVQAMEKYKQPHEKIKGLVDRALTAGFTAAEEFLLLWLAFLQYLRRRINWDKEHLEELGELRDTFLRAHNHLVEYFGSEGDKTGTILRFWARIEAYKCKNMLKSRELWNEIMMIGDNNSNISMWLEYCNLERACGDSKHLRSLYQKGLQSVSDWPESIGEAWLSFESDEGTLEEFENATAKIEARMKIINQRRLKEQISDDSWQENENASKGEKKFAKGAQKKQHNKMAAKRKFDDTTKSKSSSSVDEEGFKIPSTPSSSGAGKWENLTVQPATKKAKVSDDKESSHGEIIAHDSSKDEYSVFLSNLKYQITENEITEVFKTVGEIEQIRLVKDFKGRSKGYAYLQYKTKESAEEARKKDRELLGGRPVYVSKCEDKKKKGAMAAKTFKFGTGLEKNKLFVRGLPLETTKEEVMELFTPFGELNDVRLVTRRNGLSKGLAFVDFKTEESAANAQSKMDGVKVKENALVVAISCPPSKDASKPQNPATGNNERKEFGSRGRGRTNVLLVPRTVMRTKVVSKTSSTDKVNGSQNGNAEIVKPKSNDEFRNFLL